MGLNGRLVIPAAFRRALGIDTGDDLLITLIDGEIRLTSRTRAIEHVQEMVDVYADPGRSLVEELLAERRAEAESDDA